MLWQQFYRVKEKLYGLFVETYSVTYRMHPSATTSLFRSGYLIEIGVVGIETEFVQSKLFLSAKEDSFELYTEQSIKGIGM